MVLDARPVEMIDQRLAEGLQVSRQIWVLAFGATIKILHIWRTKQYKIKLPKVLIGKK